MRCLVAGAGGFIGGHLVARLLAEGHDVRAVDIKPLDQWWQRHDDTRAHNWDLLDLRGLYECRGVTKGMEQVYNLACDMGGIGHIETHKADCMVSVLINTNLLRASVENDIQRYFYSSSACVYHQRCQGTNVDGGHPGGLGLREEVDDYFNGGAMPEDGYGWEKLFSERMCRHFQEDYGLETRVARFHNIMGPHGSWTGGREKAPAAMCRKVAEAKREGRGSIEVWGNGKILRSFCWVDDCVDGILRLMESDHSEPINIGSSESVTVNQLIDEVEKVAVYKVGRTYDTTKPQGVHGRNSDNTICKQVLGWEPTTTLAESVARTYPWIERQVNEQVS